jgi:hypothetical protein
MTKKTDYLLFCECCAHPLKIPVYIIKSYFTNDGVKGVYCKICYKKNKLPKYLKKLGEDL